MKRKETSQVWWDTPAIAALGRLMQEDLNSLLQPTHERKRKTKEKRRKEGEKGGKDRGTEEVRQAGKGRKEGKVDSYLSLFSFLSLSKLNKLSVIIFHNYLT